MVAPWEDEQAWEIEARLDPNRLLLLQVWPDGRAEAVIHRDNVGFEPIPETSMVGILAWVNALYSAGGDGL